MAEPTAVAEVACIEEAVAELCTEGAAATEGDGAADATAAELEKRQQAITAQIEFYFSDENLPTDAFLLGRVRQNKQGWVRLSDIARFNKMKKLVRPLGDDKEPVKVAAAALRAHSTALEVSASGASVRRTAPLPSTDPFEIGARTVVVENLPPGSNITSLTELFGPDVRMVRLCAPTGAQQQRGAGSTLQTTAAAADPWGALNVVSAQPHALVEFESRGGAEAAGSARNDSSNWRTGLRVRLVCKTAPRPVAHPLDGEPEPEAEEAAEEEEGGAAAAAGASAPAAGRGAGRGRGGGRGAAKPAKKDYASWASAGAHRETVEKARAAAAAAPPSADVPPSPPPEVGGKEKAEEGGGGEGRAVLRMTAPGGGPTFREARMPDGTRGFGMGRGKAVAPAS